MRAPLVLAVFLVSCAPTGAILTLEPTEEGGTPARDGGPDSPIDAAQTRDVGAVGPGDSAPDSGTPPLAIVLVDPASPAHPLDAPLEARIGGLGFTVEERLQTLGASPADHAAVVVVSSSSESQNLPATLPDQPIPMVVLESFEFPNMGMTGPVQSQDFGVIDESTVEIVDDALSGGLPLGDLVVYSKVTQMNYAQPSAAALVVARLLPDAGTGAASASTFCYPAGAAMVTRTAPAARVGVFMRTGYSGSTTPEGWALFDAMVRWAAAQ